MRYSIKEVSERFNLSTYTLRYYESEGLLPSIQRLENGIRVYNDIDLEWLELIRCMRATGMSIAHIKDFVKLCNLGKNTVPERRRVILKQKDIIEQQIHEYKGYLKVINKKLKILDSLEDSTDQIMNPSKK
ncbi:MerR family transcriptional regulator [Clostridium sp. BL-8]|uniref:MerR family transcriptional regulator n=1 Tax=Clostridium sp. BL-8 TaxID=349938 RepID=UPI00098BD4FA|nr:MerR family transcriptional regulator [Clostridium sp. BL-8]OOM78092.1 HTH-type transcriptional regulator AdhR [Clostridium sp. BL-8]